MGLFDIFTTSAQDKAAAEQTGALNSAYQQYAALQGQGIGAVNQNFATGIGQLQPNYAAGQSALTGNFGSAINALYGAQGNAVNALGSTFTPAASAYGSALLPWMQNYGTSQQGTNQLGNVLGLNGPAGNAQAIQGFWNNPAIQSQLDIGNQNILRNQAATGQLASGKTNVDLQQFGQQTAAQGWQNYVSSLAPYLNFSNQAAGGLSGVYQGLGNLYTGLGTNLANVYGATGAGVSNAYQGLGTALNQNFMGLGNVTNQGYQNLGTSLAGLYGQQGQAAYGTQVGIGNAQANDALASLQASGNFWGAMSGLASAAAGGLGGYLGGGVAGAGGGLGGAGASPWATLGSGLGKAFGGASSTSPFPSTGAYPQSQSLFMQPFPARAGGGPVSGGRPYMVGERGPEMIIPDRPGTVIPNHMLSSPNVDPLGQQPTGNNYASGFRRFAEGASHPGVPSVKYTTEPPRQDKPANRNVPLQMDQSTIDLLEQLRKLRGGFVDGGRPDVGVPAMVGEQGPEAFVPDPLYNAPATPSWLPQSMPNPAARAIGGGMVDFARPFVEPVANLAAAPGRTAVGQQPQQPGYWSDLDEAQAQANARGLQVAAPEAATMLVGGGLPRAATTVGELGIFGGRMAKTANLDMLRKAEEMAAAGVSRDSIWTQTGWFQGADKKWKFEIPDTEAKSRIGFGAQGEQPFEHPELFKAYPQLRNATMNVEEAPKPYGAFLPSTGRRLPYIEVQGPWETDRTSVALHELSHGVQGIEGFGQGSNLNVKVLTPRQVTAAAKKIAEGMGGDWATQSPEAKKNMRDIVKFQAYQMSAGETEARNVQTRFEKGIRQTPPWKTEDVPAERQIVNFNIPGGRSALEPAPPPPRASPEEITRAAKASRGMTQPQLRGLYRDLGLTGQGPSELAAPSLLGQPQEAIDAARALKLEDRAAMNKLSAADRDLFLRSKLKGFRLPSQEISRASSKVFAPVKKEVERAEAWFDALPPEQQPTIFDLSPETLRHTPDVPQYPLPRVAPKVTERIQPAFTGGAGLRRIERAAANAPPENWGWYNNEETKPGFAAEHGPIVGPQARNAWLDSVAGTSMVNPIDNNIRTSTWYLGKILRGEPLPESLPVLDPETGKMTKTLVGGPPAGYGAKAQIQHADRVREYLANEFDPVSNAKPISYRTNLGGNWMPRTVDTHDIRNMVGMPYGKEAFGEEGGGAMLPGEYSALEELGGRAARRVGTSQAPQQGATWVGGGGYTELKSFPAAFMRALNRRIQVTARVRGVTPEQAWGDAVGGRFPLLGAGGASVGLGSALAAQYKDQPAAQARQ